MEELGAEHEEAMQTLRSEFFDQAMQEKAYEQFPEVRQGMLELCFTVHDLGVSSRTLSHWEDKGLLMGKSSRGKQRKFNLSEFVWLKVIEKLRNFNVQLDSILKLKNVLEETQSMVQYLENATVAGEIKKVWLLDNPGGTDRQWEDFLENELKVFAAKEPAMSFLSIYIIEVIISRAEFRFLIGEDGTCIPYRPEKDAVLRNVEIARELLEGSYVSICLSSIVADVVKENLDIAYNTLAVLTQSEYEMLKAVRTKGISSVEIRLDETGDPKMIEIKQDQKLNAFNRVVDLITGNGYHNIEIKVVNGKPVSCQNTRKIKLNE